MSRELYAGVSGASAAWAQLDLVTHNLANVNTAGFKARTLRFQVSEGKEAGGVLGQSYVQVAPAGADTRDGAVDETGRSLDLALQGEGFFALEDDAGKVWLTRAGRFQLDQDGFVVNPDGYRLRMSGGPIQVPFQAPREELVVRQDGMLALSSGAEIGQLEVLAGEARPVGATLWEPTGPLEDVVQDQMSLAPGERPRVRILQGHLEQSNVDPLASMVEMIEASRYFEAYQNIMKASDQADSRLIQAGRS
jgi:flagellar basal body rod protein FlgG